MNASHAVPRAAPDVDLTQEGPLGASLRQLFHAEKHEAFQSLLRQAVAHLDRIAQPSLSHLLFLLRFGERACLEPSLLQGLLDALRDRAEQDAGLRPVWQAVARRQDFRLRLQAGRKGPLTLVSLGLHCLPWTLVNRWGFRDTPQFISLQNPFCMAVHKADTVVQAIAQDFGAYAEPALMREATTPQGQRIAMRQDGGAVWNHHRGPAWLDEDYAGLRQSLTLRAESFRQSCRAEGLVFLMGDSRVDVPPKAPIPFLAPLRQALARATGQPDCRLILTSQPRRGGTRGLTWLEDGTALIAVPYPHPRYVWANDDEADSAQGLDFEQAYAEALLACLQNWGMAA
ncbi:hypothetical protein [Falsiroseomonas tokyonensis]|uniref:Uncharacterized protein n=1 Tax=Falsiroseomonas tokyonensis TaxID=430521 RepID=A0ABV7BWM8_9PROT|nr:hypothetical protein [Falsiroseomonas tokyonensis]MBU8539922.1 hypothetical protein [Falsiroseomonas tokyonensis]